MTRNNNVETGSHTYEPGIPAPFSVTGIFLAEWARTKHSMPADASNVRNTATVALNHHLSKRTLLYGAYSYDKLTANPSGSAFGVGVHHTL